MREGESEISSPSTFDLVLQPAEAMKWETHDTAEFELHTSEEGYMISRESGDNFYGVGINLGPTYLNLGEYATLEQAKQTCQEHAKQHE